MMNLFKDGGLQVYGSWQQKSVRNFTQDEQDCISSATVVESQYGNSVCFTLVTGGCTYIPLDRNSQLNVGDKVDMATAELVTFGKTGENDIMRVRA